MRTIAEPLIELEEIINYNLDAIHKLAQIANTQCKDNLKEQESIAKTIGCLWNYLKPVHRWIREQNPNQAAFYDELDKYIEEENKRASEVKIEPKPNESADKNRPPESKEKKLKK
jgi:hypothetical protein